MAWVAAYKEGHNPLIVEKLVTYTDDIKPIFKKNCAVCHSRAPLNWMDYETAYRYRHKIYERVVRLKNMPPAYWKQKPTDEERELIGKWVKTGAPK